MARGFIFLAGSVSRLLFSSARNWLRYLTFLASVVMAVVGPWLLVFAEGHAELSQQFPRLVVAVGAGHEGDIHALGERHLVGVDFGKDHLVGEAEAVVAVA